MGLDIALDYTAALRQGGGVGRYTRGIVDGLIALGSRHRFTLVHTKDADANTGPVLPSNFDWRALPLTERQATLLWQRLRVPLPAEWLIGGTDVFHSPDFVLPALWHAYGIVTIHDLSFLATPEFHEPSLQAYLASSVPRTVERAAHILADSEHTRHELITRMNVEPARVSVAYPGVEPRFHPFEPASDAELRLLEDVRTTYELHSPFILSVGTLEPRKNYDGLLRAYAKLTHTGTIDHAMVIAGGRGWLTDDHDLRALVEELGIVEHVQFAGFVVDEMLPALYNLADLVAYPSHYEGFGLPVLEAMACGTPVVTARNSSLPEVGGDAVLYVDESRDTDAIAEQIERGLTDTDLRERLRERGLEQAKRFTWEAAAHAVLDVYEQAE